LRRGGPPQINPSPFSHFFLFFWREILIKKGKKKKGEGGGGGKGCMYVNNWFKPIFSL